jgi:hypothetical protein
MVGGSAFGSASRAGSRPVELSHEWFPGDLKNRSPRFPETRHQSGYFSVYTLLVNTGSFFKDIRPRNNTTDRPLPWFAFLPFYSTT